MSDETNSLSEAERQHKKLLEQFAASPVVDVIGVVSARGAGGGRARGEELWLMTFDFDGWRVEGAAMQDGTLLLSRRVSEEELGEYRALLRPYQVARVRARVVTDPPFGGPQARLEEYVGPDAADAELNAHAELLQRPVTVDDSTFGRLTFERAYDTFKGSAAWNDSEVRLSFSAAGPEQIEATLEAARALWRDQEAWARRVNDYAVRELLPLKNDNWLDEDEAELSADEFVSRMRLETIAVYPDGSFEFWHDDGDLFFGHSILVSGDLANGPTDADIPG